MIPANNSTFPETVGLNTSAFVPQAPIYILTICTMLYVFIFVCGVVGNTIVILVVLRNRYMRTKTNYFLMNLSVADLLLIVVCMPTALMELLTKDVWYLGEIMCELVPYLENAVSHASVLTILAISLERMYAICFPLRSHIIVTSARTMHLVVGIWILALLSTVPFFLIIVYKSSRFHDNTPIVVCRVPIVLAWQKGYIISLLVLFFVIPFLALIVVYILLVKQLTNDTIFHQGDYRSLAKIKARKQVVVMVFLVVVCFFGFMLPLRVLSIWFAFTATSNIENLGFEGYLNLLYFARIMYYLNSCVNPILYNMVSTKFRTAFKRTLRMPCRPIKSEYSTSLRLTARGCNKPSISSSSSKERVDSSLRYSRVNSFASNEYRPSPGQFRQRSGNVLDVVITKHPQP